MPGACVMGCEPILAVCLGITVAVMLMAAVGNHGEDQVAFGQYTDNAVDSTHTTPHVLPGAAGPVHTDAAGA